jgi:nitronate monooxygenase
VLETELTRRFGLTVPLVSAPMAGASGGALAVAVSAAGGLGMIGVGSSTPADWISEQGALAAASGRT